MNAGSPRKISRVGKNAGSNSVDHDLNQSALNSYLTNPLPLFPFQ